MGEVEVGQVGEGGQSGGEAGQEVVREVEVGEAGGERGQARAGQGEELGGDQVELTENISVFL